jgi:hypothetical protein
MKVNIDNSSKSLLDTILYLYPSLTFEPTQVELLSVPHVIQLFTAVIYK